jgi:hypothetical protein
MSKMINVKKRYSLGELEDLQHAGYVVEVPKTKFDRDYLLKNIKVPVNKAAIPKIIGWSGPSRSGTSSLLFLLASNSKVDKAYFQPQKSILREGGPIFDINEAHSLICMKEVFRSCCPADNHDPVASLLEAGVPAENITWITLLRNPIHNFASWWQLFPGTTVEDYKSTFNYALQFFYKYQKSNVKMIPFAYDLLGLGEEMVLRALLNKVNPELDFTDLTFSEDEIAKKVQFGQLNNKSTFDIYVKPTLERKKIVYVSRVNDLPPTSVKKLEKGCLEGFQTFHNLSKSELGL